MTQTAAPPLDQDTVLAASSPAGFAYVASRDDPTPYVPENFHLRIAESIVDIEQGRLELLVNEAPVQHGKTLTTSVWSAAWMLGLHPTWQILSATYNTDFAEDKIGRPTRDILQRHGARFFGVSVDQSSHSMKRWNTTKGGGMLAVGVEKPVTGRPGHFINIDDPYADLAHAMNPKHRAEIVEWFKANVLSRRPDPLRLAVTMSRWTDDDFIAWIIDQAREHGWKYRVLDFPAIAVCRVDGCDSPKFQFVRNEQTGVTSAEMDVCEHEERDELGRLPGEALWPRVRPISFLLRQLVDMGSRLFLALFQARPQRAGGSIFRKEWFRYFKRDGDMLHLLGQAGDIIRSYAISTCRVFQIVDLSSGDTQTLRSGITRTKARPDYTVIGTFALCPRMELAVLDIYRDNKIDGTEQIPLLAALRSKYGAGRIGIEAVAYQWTAVQNAVKLGLPAVPITRGQESKETRAWTIATRCETGQVYFQQGASWVDALETELTAFPNGANDDQVDVMSDAGAVVADAAHRPMPAGVQVA